MSELQIWPHVLAALTRARDAAGPHDSARFALAQLVIAFTGAGEMLAAEHVDGAIDLLADVEAATCAACRKPLDASAETTGEAEAVTLCGVCLGVAAREDATRAARAPCPTCERPHDPQDCCQA